MKHLLLIPVILLSPPAWAQQEEPSWEVKKAALIDAYHANGDRMSGWGMYERDTPRVVQTEPVTPVAKAEVKNELDQQADQQPRQVSTKTDICARHGMHKVIKGDSWRCRK
jgi:hypothetical protein